MFEKELALERLRSEGIRSSLGYRLHLHNVILWVRKVDRELGIYKITMETIMPQRKIREVEEMTPEQAIDRFEEFFGTIHVADALLGWTNGI